MQIVSEPGMKALVLDGETAGIVSMVVPMSDILQMGVILVDRIDTKHAPLFEAVAVCFLRPDSVREFGG